MTDSRCSIAKVSNYDVVESTPFKKDPMRELAAAAQKRGIKLFFYYSQLDWHNEDYFPHGRTGHFTKRQAVGRMGKIYPISECPDPGAAYAVWPYWRHLV